MFIFLICSSLSKTSILELTRLSIPTVPILGRKYRGEAESPFYAIY